MKNIRVFAWVRRHWRWLPLVYAGLLLILTQLWPPPAAVGLGGPERETDNVVFLQDESWLDQGGQRQLKQSIFDHVVQMIATAEKFVLIDMFLFNDWQGPVKETQRALASELSSALVARKQALPEMTIIVISDPINTVYGGLPSVHFDAMRAAGIQVVLTDLTALQDSNPVYSGVWRWLIRPFGNSRGSLLPNPLGPGRVSLRSYFALANFKANHRKLIVSDSPDGSMRALITSANPHDGSSAHRNVALQFSGEAVLDVLAAEKALLDMSGFRGELPDWPNPADARLVADAGSAPARVESHGHYPGSSLQLLNESRIKDAILAELNKAGGGTTINLVMFYLAERDIIEALKSARSRGADVRLLLDVNRDAFGRKKNGVPNRPVAAELNAAGVKVRWCETRGEQCHAKMLHVDNDGSHSLLLGSGNFTRRNLDDYNLESNILLRSSAESSAMQTAIQSFENQWNNAESRTYSAAYETYSDESLWLTLQYRLMEATGLSTF